MTASLQSQPTDRRSFHTLDGIRGVAAILVMAWHAEAVLDPSQTIGWRPASGYLAVDLFFILSGFVLAHAYDERFAAGMTTLAFTRIRLIRLYPLYIAGVALAALAFAAGIALHFQSSWTLNRLVIASAISLFFLPTARILSSNFALYPLNPPTWSVGLELFVNIIIAPIWKLLDVRLLMIVVGLGAVGLIASDALFGSLNTGSRWVDAWGGVARVIFAFPLGILLRRIRPNRPLGVPSWLFLVLAAGLLVCPAPAGIRPFYDAACDLLLFPALVLGASMSEPQRRARHAYVFLGVTSYAIYALHVPTMAILGKLLARLSVHGWPVEIGVLASIIVGCWIMDRFYDTPARAWLARLGRQKMALAEHTPRTKP